VKDTFIWVDSDTAVNIELIEYVKFSADEVRLSFHSGEPLLLKGEAARNLREFMRSMGLRESYKPIAKPGYRKGFIG
jgi:hypothetical protein